MTRGKASDRSALAAHRTRINPPPPGRYSMATYGFRIDVSPELASVLAREGRGGIPNLGNRWRPKHGKRGGMRRRYMPYRDAANGPWSDD